MKTLAHLSDLHFGKLDEGIMQAAITKVRALRPDIVVVSGDLTQRARRKQYLEARQFLNALPFHKLVVPGNHDMPLGNIFTRLTSPLKNYKTYINPNPEASYEDDELVILGVSSPRWFRATQGYLRAKDLERVRQRVRAVEGDKLKIIVTHHPMPRLADGGADILLSGHTHRTDVSPIGRALRISCGTTTSLETRYETNAFNLIRIQSGRVVFIPVRWNSAPQAFLEEQPQEFKRTSEGWSKIGERAKSAVAEP